MPEENDLSFEEIRAEALAIQQASHQVASFFNNLLDEGRSYQKPSKFKYFILFSLATIVDGLDFLELTGIGWFLAKLISILATLLIISIFFFTGTKQKRAKTYHKNLKEFLETTGRNLAHATRMVIRIGKVAEYTPFLSGIVEFILASAANLIPFLDLFPWMIIGVALSYLDEKKTLQSAAEAAEAVAEIGEGVLEDVENREEELSLAT